MAVTLTERAAQEIQRVLKESNKPDGTILRVGVAAGGCSGFQYDFRFDETGGNAEKDQITQHHGVTVAVDNVVKSCGCGSSFSA
jgi:iron-sulfur cluster assembly protein